MIAAIKRYKRGRTTTKEVAEEMADVSIMLDALQLIVGSIDIAKQNKINRLIGRMKDSTTL